MYLFLHTSLVHLAAVHFVRSSTSDRIQVPPCTQNNIMHNDDCICRMCDDLRYDPYCVFHPGIQSLIVGFDRIEGNLGCAIHHGVLEQSRPWQGQASLASHHWELDGLCNGIPVDLLGVGGWF